MPTIDETIEYVRALFNGVSDKGGAPYAEHCIRVCRRLDDCATIDERHAALLHDVLEDTPVTRAELLDRGYSLRTVELVDSLTRKPADGTYAEWIGTIAASGDAGLIRIKIADNMDNLDEARLSALPPEKADRFRAQYQSSVAILTAALHAKA